MSAEPLTVLAFEAEWRDQAACRDADPRLFDYDPETDAESTGEPARRICAGCPVRTACLSSALSWPAEDDSVGIYGGLTPAERADRRAQETRQHFPAGNRSWGLGADPAFARISFDLATGIGVQAAAEALGVTGRTLQRSWKRHVLGPLRLGRTLRTDVAPYLTGRALRELGWIEHEARIGHLACDPEFAVSSFALAGELGTIRAAKPPTLRRAFAHHGLGHPHAGLDRSELRRRWSTEAEGEPDHHQRRQRRLHRARLAAERWSL